MRRAFALAACLEVAVGAMRSGPAAASEPKWLTARAGVTARVDNAQWPDSDEPEAALTDSAASSALDFSGSASRPGDVHYAPIGVRVRIERVLPGGVVALVHSVGGRWSAFARIERLVPDVPPGTALVAAGGFGGFADFYPALRAGEAQSQRLATGSRLVVLGTGVAPFDPDSSDFVRLRVRIASGPWHGRTGWLAAVYTGLPLTRVPADADVAEHACMCRLIHFDPRRT